MASNQGTAKGQTGIGFWNCARASYSKETQELLKVMMQESKLNQFQKRQLNIKLQEGEAFPVSCHPSSSKVSAASALPAAPCVQVQPSSKPHLRPAESCRAGDAYVRERFRPRPTRNLEKEKQRLQNLMATGKDGPEPSHKPKPAKQEEETPEVDRFEELCNEIEERRQFLEQMESFGRGKEFRAIIQTEISQKLKEMEEIDRTRNHELEMATRERERGDTCSQCQVKNGNNA
ncbi:UPF0193 protein EVG1 isoform X1 [Hemiscyllium ocellatum]|uniref:UPF0193 protein EVG1 isoform X1 n=2 Tax=Hemiscyllium ocellatum TaxID=170820 RepID=UPI0029661EB7|nr:UPF0193 protein EVG1 isoform X1 [Hemiscyllium ocellatum]